MALEDSFSTVETLLLRSVARLRTSADAPLVFGGVQTEGRVPITVAVGNRSVGLHNLTIRPGRGLGGQAWERQSPQSVRDYGSARTITHDYDREILGEGVRAFAAVPVFSGKALAGLIYVGVRGEPRLPNFLWSALIREGARMSTELAAQVQALSVPERDEVLGACRRELAMLRRFYADVRRVASTSNNETLGPQLRALVDQAFMPTSPIVLTPRQVDVLALAAVGHRNSEIADLLGLSPGTVKGYLRAVFSRLDVHSRNAAVVRARELGLLG